MNQFKWKVLELTTFLKYRLSIDVLVQMETGKPPTESDLQNIAKSLFSAHKGRKYDKVFICYYLPGMVKDEGAWATSHFTPKLEVRIIGNLQETKTEE